MPFYVRNLNIFRFWHPWGPGTKPLWILMCKTKKQETQKAGTKTGWLTLSHSQAVQWPWLGEEQGQQCPDGGLQKRMCITHLYHCLPQDWRVQLAKLRILHFEFPYFRKFDTKWQMNANYTSIEQLKLEMLSTGSLVIQLLLLCLHIKWFVSVPSGWQKAHSPAWGNITCTCAGMWTHIEHPSFPLNKTGIWTTSAFPQFPRGEEGKGLPDRAQGAA
jgi:hypothetical protein